MVNKAFLSKNSSKADEFLGGITGRTFQCLKAKQFEALQFGDRYFFTHSNGAAKFTGGLKDK